FPTAKVNLEKIRGLFVEYECEALLKRTLPRLSVYRDVFWTDEAGNRIQSDILAFIENWLFIFEAKGAIYPDRLRAGHFVKAQSFIKDVYGEAASQSERLATRIKNSQGTLSLYDQSG